MSTMTTECFLTCDFPSRNSSERYETGKGRVLRCEAGKGPGLVLAGCRPRSGQRGQEGGLFLHDKQRQVSATLQSLIILALVCLTIVMRRFLGCWIGARDGIRWFCAVWTPKKRLRRHQSRTVECETQSQSAARTLAFPHGD